MKTTLTNTLIALSCVTGGALVAFAIASFVAAFGGAALLPMGIQAFIASGALMGATLAGMAVRPAATPQAN